MSQKIKFEKIVPEGKALGRWHDKAIFAVGPLPEETVEVRVIREKRTWTEAAMIRVIEPSTHRQVELESHYLSCSPWQSVDYKYQQEIKLDMLSEIYSQPQLKLEVKKFHGAKKILGYRNKLEFSVYNFDGEFQLAFHERGKFDSFLAAPNGCVLGTDAMNKFAKLVAEELVLQKLNSHVQTITVRESMSHNSVVAIVVVNPQSEKLVWGKLNTIPGLKGLRVVTKLKHNKYKTLHLEGDTDLEEIVGGVAMKYPWDSFFQVNIEMFEIVLKDIRSKITKDARVLDLYGGAGSIGLALAKDGHHVVGVELIEASVKLANANAISAGLENYHAICASAESISAESFNDIDIVVVDPPRAGLHKDMTAMLLETTPKRIIYVSCNPVTQARDLAILEKKYKLSFVTGYDLYPGTLHLESLVVLDRK